MNNSDAQTMYNYIYYINESIHPQYLQLHYGRLCTFKHIMSISECDRQRLKRIVILEKSDEVGCITLFFFSLISLVILQYYSSVRVHHVLYAIL